MSEIRKVLALIRASWLHVMSYRMQLAVSLTGLFVAVVPVYFVSNALQSTMAGAVRGQGGQYFAFLIVGMATYACITTAVGALHASLSSEIRSGGLEALLSTPTSLAVLVIGMVGQAFSLTAIRVAVLLLAAWVLGAQFVWSSAFLSFGILVLLVVAYLGLGILAASLVLAFKSPGPLPAFILSLSAILGGVYYPTHVIPAWLRHASSAVPLTYGLRALRQALLEGAPLAAVRADLAVLSVFAVVLLLAGGLVLSSAVKYARATGTLAHY